MYDPTIIDPDYHENEILRNANPQGIFKFAMMAQGNLLAAFQRLLVDDNAVFLDIVMELVPVVQAKGKEPSVQPMTVKIYKLTEKGWSRKRKLQIKFPPDKPMMTLVSVPPPADQ